MAFVVHLIPYIPTEIHVDVSFPHELLETEIRVVVSRVHYFWGGFRPVEEVTHNLFRRCAPRHLRNPEAMKRSISSLLTRIRHPVHDDVVFWRNSITSIAQRAAAQAHESGCGSFKILAEIKIFRRDNPISALGRRQTPRPAPWLRFPRTEQIDEVLRLSVHGRDSGGSHAEAPRTELIDEVLMLSVDGRDSGGSHAVPPAQASPIDKLERVKFIEGSGSDQMTTTTTACVICMDDFEQGSELIKMPCSHVFHESCLTRWLERSPVCPLCRFSLPA